MLRIPPKFVSIAIAATFVAVIVTGGAAATGPKPRQVISNPFHEYSGIPGLKLGYGDVLAQCQTYDNANNANPYAPFITSVNAIAGDKYNVGAGVNNGCRTPRTKRPLRSIPAIR